jgi:hypothetical protein
LRERHAPARMPLCASVRSWSSTTSPTSSTTSPPGARTSSAARFSQRLACRWASDSQISSAARLVEPGHGRHGPALVMFLVGVCGRERRAGAVDERPWRARCVALLRRHSRRACATCSRAAKRYRRGPRDCRGQTRASGRLATVELRSCWSTPGKAILDA